KLAGMAILRVAFGRQVGGEALVDSLCAGFAEVGLVRVSLMPIVPVIAVGAPVRAYYPEIARRLGAELVFPPFCEVANAVGAATGTIARSVTVTVDGDGNGLFRVHTPQRTLTLANAGLAIAEAEAAARASAEATVIEMGGEQPEIRVSIERQFLPDAVN